MRTLDKIKYWNPVLETLPREKLEALQLKKFKQALTWAYRHSPFYTKHYQDVGLEPGDIKTWEDVWNVPKVEKDMLREVQERDPFPYGDILSVQRRMTVGPC